MTPSSADPGATPTTPRSPYLEALDPQTPPQEYMSRAIAVDPADLLESEAWSLLVKARETDDPALLEEARSILRAMPTLG